MTKTLILLSYSFPPANIIGAVRPYQIAQFFHDKGWTVHVVCCADPAIPETYQADTSDFHVHEIPASPLVTWASSPAERKGGALCTLRYHINRVAKFAARTLMFPEHFSPLEKGFVHKALDISKNTNIDLVISSALPFMLHSAGQNIAKRLCVPWVADNRDLWASSPYRKCVGFRRKLDLWYEAKLLRQASCVTGVTQAMIQHYKNALDLPQTILAMNGYTPPIDQPATSEYKHPDTDSALHIVYGGSLYGGLRDPAPLLEAISEDASLQKSLIVDFYGSEPDFVSKLQSKYPKCNVMCHGRQTKSEITKTYQAADILLVILGNSSFESGVMTGKFFEYIAFGKPIIAIANDGSELSSTITTYQLGLASRDRTTIQSYLHGLLSGTGAPIQLYPAELSIHHQLHRIYDALQT